jgi:hypothetical protein
VARARLADQRDLGPVRPDLPSSAAQLHRLVAAVDSAVVAQSHEDGDRVQPQRPNAGLAGQSGRTSYRRGQPSRHAGVTSSSRRLLSCGCASAHRIPARCCVGRRAGALAETTALRRTGSLRRAPRAETHCSLGRIRAAAGTRRGARRPLLL